MQVCLIKVNSGEGVLSDRRNNRQIRDRKLIG